METKKIRRRFELADYVEEENFLQEEHKNGWKMVDLKLPFSTYIFEKCEPQEYVYQLDFKQQGNDLGEYLQLFEDCGWEYFYKYGNWYYFRKLKSEIEEENAIFSDAPSRAEMAKKVVKFQGMIALAALVPLSYLIPVLLNRSEGRSNVLLALLVLVIGITVILLGVHLRNFLKLTEIIKREELK
ncbi:hypothetical protein UAW_01489 [Enterococcus haemoperoxidus ATCC BAA-382]|uniref:DUF2812 domain-containing protein n=1 Tax=Enterococcus haemoperoxidus ATCC BAA-382 TaxID=1158608 RepID=R2QSZ8_9ENTE|nr:DUF2812 domain-containing protein [Enterococcus haemoperoxidus]EOH98308.1 hypothetical protein UAW_01489 [Enterococcus haemoperoxidus ATCC BAA-382]EOT59821.1 hypothetical protein I583_02456 [Enterococcus haemoperoxidus ATCC BAA-382]